MKNKSAILVIFLFVISLTSCKENIESKMTDKNVVWDEKNPPPPPSAEFMAEMKANTPPPSAVIEAIKSTMLSKGATVLEVSEQINEYKNQLKKDCPPCYAELKDK